MAGAFLWNIDEDTGKSQKRVCKDILTQVFCRISKDFDSIIEAMEVS